METDATDNTEAKRDSSDKTPKDTVARLPTLQVVVILWIQDRIERSKVIVY